VRIGADGSWMRWTRTGLGRYLDGLLHAMAAQLPSDDRLTVYYNSTPGPQLFDAPVRERSLRIPTATAWNQLALPVALAADRCDVYLGGANIVPALARQPRVVVMLDCLAFHRTDAHGGRWGRYLRRWQRISANRAATVIAISVWTAKECVLHLGVDPESIHVVPCGVGADFRPLAGPERVEEERRLRARLRLSRPFVLQVGGWDYKGAPAAAAAMRTLHDRGHDVDLVRVGAGLHGDGTDHLRVLGYVDEPTLRALYRSAAAVCVASSLEGFGLPVLEAMASGTPVVASAAGGLPEAGGDAAIYADGGDARQLADALERVIADPGEAERRRIAGLERAAAFSWERAATAVLEVLRGAAG
jgi:alpha-1,3-rhamnosyl/mannosyltransferase